MTDEAPAPQPIGLLVQPQPALGRVVVAIMQGPLMLAHVWFEDAAHMDQIINQMVGARVETFGLPDIQGLADEALGTGSARTWSCKLGDDCACINPMGPPDHNSPCPNFQGTH